MNTHHRSFALLFALALADVGCAQAVSTAAAEQVVKLNPFVLSEGKSVGYQAISSAAGTRINTPLRDLATTISVITTEFLEDTGSANLQDLLVYTAGTEVLGVGGNFSNPNASTSVGGIQESQFTRPAQNTRVRGLAAADLARDYFPTAIAMDAYNTDRVSINRGANSILFGLGSPAGIINTSTILPMFRNRTKLEAAGGSYGTFRSSFDAEHVLLDRRLSLRAAGLYEDEKYRQDPAFERDRRAFVVGEYRPRESTSLRLSYENGRIDANRPRLIPPQDMVSRWFDVSPTGAAKPVHDPHNRNALNLYHPVTGVNVAPLYWGPPAFTFQPVVVYGSPDMNVGSRQVPNGSDAFIPILDSRWGAQANNGVTQPAFVTLRGLNQLLDRLGGTDQNGNSKAATRNFYVNEVIQDPSFFDFNNLLIDGPTKRESERFDTLNLGLSQTFLRNTAGLSYAYNREDYRSSFRQLLDDGSRFQAIGIDANVTLPNGNTNPNFGRPFISSANERISTRSIEQSVHRLTGYWKIDAAERLPGALGRWLGRHTVTALGESSASESRDLNYFAHVWGADFKTPNGTQLPSIMDQVGSLIYVGPSLANATSSAGAGVSNLRTNLVVQPQYSMSYFNTATRTWGVKSFSVENNVPNRSGSRLSRQDIDSRALVLHSAFLRDHLVGTFGWRTDEVDIWSNNNAPVLTDGRANFSPNAFFLPAAPTYRSSTDTFSWGLVGHVPSEWLRRLPARPGLSVHYAESENSRIGVERIDLRGKTLAPVSGLTTEKGFTVSLLDQRVSLRANWYETQQLKDDSGLTGQFLSMIGPMNSLFPPAVREQTIAANRLNQPDIATLRSYPGIPAYARELLNFRVNPDGLTVTTDVPSGLTMPSDLISKGFELEMVANVTPNWRLMFNAAQQKVAAANTAPQLAAFIGEIEQVLATYGKFPAGPTSTETLGDFVNRVGLIAAKTKISEDGAYKTNEVREWRANLITNYEFKRESRLKGWNVGSAVRWQGKVGIGRPVIRDPVLGYVSDLANPFYGPEEWKMDGWVGYTCEVSLFGRKTQWRVQLNVRNVLDEDDLIPVFANPDGTIPVIRLPEDRTWELRSSFAF